MPRVCKAGNVMRLRCVKALKGRKGQGKGKGKMHIECKYGRRSSGLCRTKRHHGRLMKKVHKNVARSERRALKAQTAANTAANS